MCKTTELKKKESDNTEFEKQKIVYDKASELHRYYLSWRQFLFAGFIAVTGLIIFKCCETSDQLIIAILLSIVSIVSLVFYFLDKRNCELYHICQKVESKIEDNWFESKEGEEKTEGSIKLYKRLDLSYQEDFQETLFAQRITHTLIIKILFVGCSIISFVFSILFLYSYCNCIK